MKIKISLLDFSQIRDSEFLECNIHSSYEVNFFAIRYVSSFLPFAWKKLIVYEEYPFWMIISWKLQLLVNILKHFINIHSSLLLLNSHENPMHFNLGMNDISFLSAVTSKSVPKSLPMLFSAHNFHVVSTWWMEASALPGSLPILVNSILESSQWIYIHQARRIWYGRISICIRFRTVDNIGPHTKNT